MVLGEKGFAPVDARDKPEQHDLKQDQEERQDGDDEERLYQLSRRCAPKGRESPVSVGADLDRARSVLVAASPVMVSHPFFVISCAG